MKNSIIVFLLTIFSFQIAIAQNLNNYTAPTEEHVLVKGTNVSIILPEESNFVASPHFSGFQIPNDNRTSIIVMKQEAPYSVMSQSFSDKKTMDAQGMIINQKKTVKINGKDALLLDLTKKEKGIVLSKKLLIWGDSNSTTFIITTALQEDQELVLKLKKSIESVVINN